MTSRSNFIVETKVFFGKRIMRVTHHPSGRSRIFYAKDDNTGTTPREAVAALWDDLAVAGWADPRPSENDE